MSGRVVRMIIYQDRAGLWRWRLRAANNRIVADSGEGYATRSNCRRAALGLPVLLEETTQ